MSKSALRFLIFGQLGIVFLSLLLIAHFYGPFTKEDPGDLPREIRIVDCLQPLSESGDMNPGYLTIFQCEEGTLLPCSEHPLADGEDWVLCSNPN